MKNLLSVFSKTNAAALTDAEMAADISIDSLEKCYALQAEYRIALDAPETSIARSSLLRKKNNEVQKAIAQLQYNDAKLRTLAAIRTDIDKAEAARSGAIAALPKLNSALAKERQKYEALTFRLAKLEDSLVKAQKTEASDLSALQDAFDKALAAGDEAAEAKAAEALFKAKNVKSGDTTVTGPIELRISAVNIELEAVGVKIDESAMAVDQAEQAGLKATADLAFLAYKTKVNELFAAYLVHQKAVAQCSPDIAERLPKVVDFVVAVGDKTNLDWLGNAADMDGYMRQPESSNLPLVWEPDLNILAANVNDLAPAAKEVFFDMRATVQYTELHPVTQAA